MSDGKLVKIVMTTFAYCPSCYFYLYGMRREKGFKKEQTTEEEEKSKKESVRAG